MADGSQKLQHVVTGVGVVRLELVELGVLDHLGVGRRIELRCRVKAGQSAGLRFPSVLKGQGLGPRR